MLLAMEIMKKLKLSLDSHPWKLIIVLGADIFMSYVTIFSIHVYAPQFLSSLGVPWKEIGYHVGALTNIAMTGTAVGTLATCIIMQYVNHKRCLVVLLLLQGVSCIIYGFSRTVNFAYIAIFLVGLSGANQMCAKVFVSRMCNEENQNHITAWVVSGPIMMSMSIGPAVAGLLALPASKYTKVFSNDGIFGKYPILLLQLSIGSVLLVLSLLTYLVFILEDKKQNQDYEILSNSNTCSESIEVSIKTIFLEDVLYNPSCIAACVSFSIFGALEAGFEALLSLWLSVPRRHFGRGYSTDESGKLYFYTGVVTMIVNYSVLGKFNSLMKTRVAIGIWKLILLFVASITPILWYIDGERLFYAALLINTTMYLIGIAGCYTPYNIIVQNSVPLRANALMFTVSHVVCRLAEGLLINLFTSLFNWSIENSSVGDKYRQYPFDFHFSFFCLAICFLFNYMVVLFVRSDIEKRPT